MKEITEALDFTRIKKFCCEKRCQKNQKIQDILKADTSGKGLLSKSCKELVESNNTTKKYMV